MLDQQDRQAALVAQAADQRPERRHLLVVQPAGGLVEQQERRPAGERARELDALQRRKGQPGRRMRRQRVDPEELAAAPPPRAGSARPRA